MTQTNIFSDAACSMEEKSALHPTITVTPATRPSNQNATQLKHQTNIRVAAYCRVSTSNECQQTSYDRQKHFYTHLITEHPGWSLAGIYADTDASGTNTERRIQFKQMIADCKAGKIDYIITKSISRFARNTVDTLNHVRMLKQLSPAVGIFFEKENVDTLDAAGELLLTILSALAQDESRSISDNVRWAYSKKFQAGIAHCNLKGMMGYDKGEDGQWIINEPQAEIIRLIFDMYLTGDSACKISRELNAKGIRTLFGRLWDASAVMRVLKNEKYMGDCELQKTIVKDFLTHHSSKNHGEAPRYYVKNHHSPIISREKWQKAQQMISELDGTKRKKEQNTANNMKTSGKRSVPVKGQTFYNLCCAGITDGNVCNGTYYRSIYNRTIANYNDERSIKSKAVHTGTDPDNNMREVYKYTFAVWRCCNRFGKKQGNKMVRTGEENCTAPILYEIALEQSYMEMLYRLKRDYESNGKRCMVMQGYHSALEKTERRCHKEMNINFELFLSCLLNLPEKNEMGMDIIVFGSDRRNTPVQNCHKYPELCPDLLPFKRGLYTAFVDSAAVYKDEIEYRMNFGATLKSSGNQRMLNAFLGYRRCSANTIQIISNIWEVTNNTIQYRRIRKKS